MPSAPDNAALAALLPGTWHLGATNFAIWLGGDRLRPQFRYDLKTADPLVLREMVSYTAARGVEKTFVGTDRLRSHHHGGDSFVWRGAGLHCFVTGRWSVVGATEDSNILVIRRAKSTRASAGVDVIVRDETGSHAFRTKVAGLSESLGLTRGEFASLTWLELAD
ncbi:MAG: hypothetical protein H7279_09310 [Microbacteriaceae bacterium]|nr:hypothetical protein [Microbacteriaceae bacterium]